jgi:hypothetical protein
MLLLLALSTNISFVCQLLKTAGVLADRYGELEAMRFFPAD